MSPNLSPPTKMIDLTEGEKRRHAAISDTWESKASAPRMSSGLADVNAMPGKRDGADLLHKRAQRFPHFPLVKAIRCASGLTRGIEKCKAD